MPGVMLRRDLVTASRNWDFYFVLLLNDRTIIKFIKFQIMRKVFLLFYGTHTVQNRLQLYSLEALRDITKRVCVCFLI